MSRKDAISILGRLDEALEVTASAEFDIAIFDLKLGADMTFPVVDRPIEMEKAFIFFDRIWRRRRGLLQAAHTRKTL